MSLKGIRVLHRIQSVFLCVVILYFCLVNYSSKWMLMKGKGFWSAAVNRLCYVLPRAVCIVSMNYLFNRFAFRIKEQAVSTLSIMSLSSEERTFVYTTSMTFGFTVFFFALMGPGSYWQIFTSGTELAYIANVLTHAIARTAAAMAIGRIIRLPLSFTPKKLSAKKMALLIGIDASCFYISSRIPAPMLWDTWTFFFEPRMGFAALLYVGMWATLIGLGVVEWSTLGSLDIAYDDTRKDREPAISDADFNEVDEVVYFKELDKVADFNEVDEVAYFKEVDKVSDSSEANSLSADDNRAIVTRNRVIFGRYSVSSDSSNPSDDY